MARERAVTRTINVTKVTCICMDIDKMENSEQSFNLTGEVPTNDKALKEAKKLYETETFKIVAIKNTETIEKLYGMPEVEFLKYAKELDPETRKVLE